MLKMGVIGTGAIVTQFVKEAAQHGNIEIVGVVARNLTKTQQFAEEFGIPCVYQSVAALLENDEIEAVYIGTLHPTHAQYSLQALKAKKHVLCEKPAAIKPWQLKEVFLAAKRNNVLFMEAMIVGFHPLYQEIKKLIAQGTIGEVTHIESTFGQISQKTHKHAPEEAGGCIYDIGIYNMFLICDLLGMPTKIQAQMRPHREWDVIGSVQMLATHPNNAQSYSLMTMDAISSTSAMIMGTKGSIRINSSWTNPKGYDLILADGTLTQKTLEHDVWLGHEINAFYQLIQSGKLESEIMPHQMSLDLQLLIEQLHDVLNVTVPERCIFM